MGAKDDFLQRQPYIGAKVFPVSPGTSPARLLRAPEEHVEEIRNTARAEILERLVVGSTELIEAGTPVGIRQDRVRLADLFEFLLGLGVVGVNVRVVAPGKPTVGRFDLVR